MASLYLRLHHSLMAATKKKASPYGRIKFSSVEEYHASFPKEIQKILQQLRGVIKTAAPMATETISYNIPTFKLQKTLVHYAAYKGHIGFYPTSRPMLVFKNELAAYKTSKGAIQFPIDQALPLDLIQKIVRFRVQEETGNPHR